MSHSLASHSPHPRGEDAARLLEDIANETIEALNDGVVDVSITQQHTQLFLESSQQLSAWHHSPPRNPIISTKIEVLALSALKGTRYLNSNPQPSQKIGVLSFAVATNPGGGFLYGDIGQEETIVRSSSLYASLATDVASQFYNLHLGEGENSGYYTHAMIYSPNVHLFRDDHGAWLDPLAVDVISSSAVNARVVRRHSHPGRRLEQKIEDTMRERMARILALFEMKGATSLVLGSFGTGRAQNDVEMVASIWSDLLMSNNARFKSSFTEVVFCIPDAQTRGMFERALVSQATSASVDGDSVF